MVSFEDLLEVFWSGHEPCRRSRSTQYAAILFYHDETQRRAAEASRDGLAGARGDTVRTELKAAGTFYRAEDYHQKYYLRSSPVGKSVRELLDSELAFVDSTAVARINGHFGGHLSVARLAKSMLGEGLSVEGERRVNRVWRVDAAAK